MPDPMTADVLSVPRREEDAPSGAAAVASELAPKPQAAKRPPIKAVEPPVAQSAKSAAKAGVPPFGAGYEMLSETIGQAQDIARKTALQLADTRLRQATAMIDLQQKLLEMAHANMAASFAAAQKIVTSTNLGEALTLHKRFAQDQVATLTEQASELRRVASRMSGETAEPWADYWSKSFDRIRKTFGG